MAKTKSKIAQPKTSEQREGNRYTRAARVLAKNDKIDVKTLADRALMSETTAARFKEAWDAVIAALIEVGRLPDPANAAAKRQRRRRHPSRSKPNPPQQVQRSPSNRRTPLSTRGARRYPDPSLFERYAPGRKIGGFFGGKLRAGYARALRDVWKIQKPGSKPMGGS
jgi:hypothetical protein